MDNWEIRKGDSKLTVIKAVQPDSGKSFLVLVSDYPNFKLKEGEITDKQLQEDKINAIAIFKSKNMTPQNYQVVKGYLNNFPASIATFTTEVKSQTDVLTYKYKHISCFKGGLLYNLTISMPSVFWTNDENKRINRVIESFVLHCSGFRFVPVLFSLDEVPIRIEQTSLLC